MKPKGLGKLWGLGPKIGLITTEDVHTIAPAGLLANHPHPGLNLSNIRTKIPQTLRFFVRHHDCLLM